MGGREHPLNVLSRLISERLLTLFSGLLCDKSCCYWVSLLVLFGSLCNVLRLLPFLLLFMGIYMVSLRGNAEFVKEILFPPIFLLLVWNTFPGCLIRVRSTLTSISTLNVVLCSRGKLFSFYIWCPITLPVWYVVS